MSEKLVVEANDVYKALGIVSRKVAEFENRINNLSRENARLRELVRNWQELYEAPDYGDCIRLMKRMRELGVEVDDV